MPPSHVVQQKSKKPTSSGPNLQNRKRKFHTPLHEGLVAGLETEAILKCGMEVGLISPRSGKMVSLGTIQKTDKNAISVDGQALNDCVDILVNSVFNQHTVLPRAHGMISKLGSAQAHCNPWPRVNLMHPSGQALHSKVSTISRADQGNLV